MTLRAFALALTLASATALLAPTPVQAEVIFDPFAPNGETTSVSGPYKRFQTHVLKLSAHRYAVLFRPGYVDLATAVKTIRPLCAAQGREAHADSRTAAVDVLLVDGVPTVQQGFRISCVNPAN